MGNLDSRQDHLALGETGRIKLTKEQRDTIEDLLTGVHLTLEEDPADLMDDKATMDLPILGKKVPK